MNQFQQAIFKRKQAKIFYSFLLKFTFLSLRFLADSIPKRNLRKTFFLSAGNVHSSFDSSGQVQERSKFPYRFAEYFSSSHTRLTMSDVYRVWMTAKLDSIDISVLLKLIKIIDEVCLSALPIGNQSKHVIS